jgi:hypothetical protein
MTAIQQTPALLPPAAADRAAGVRLKSKDERSGINNRSEQSIYPTPKSVLTSGATPTLGFERLAKLTAMSSMSLHRMLSPKGNPSMDNLAAIFSAVRKCLKVGLKAHTVNLQKVA